jgi:class 3 adenylate cyclase/predicted ATPase
VLFCDLVDSTALSARLDVEDMHAVVRAYQSACSAAVARHDGFVAKFMGDGLLAYFGYPSAQEQDPERAVQAALDIVSSIGSLPTPAGQALAVRIGIATGVVVIGDLLGSGAAAERLVVGETPNLAARLQAIAEPNTVVIAETTRRQIGNLFELSDLGPQELKGFGRPQSAWRVHQAKSAAPNRFKALRSGDLPLVGRAAEFRLLAERWASAKSGQGRVVLIAAEAGMGKSRLAAALREHIRGEQHVALRYFCSPHHGQSAFHPIIGQLERAAGFAADDDADVRRRKLIEMLAGGPAEAELPLLAELLSVPGFEPLVGLTPESRRDRMIEALAGLLNDVVTRQPVLVVFEDVHWIDPTSRALLDRMIDAVRELPVLVIVTFRPEIREHWSRDRHVSLLSLPRLDRHAAATLVRNLDAAAALPSDALPEIVERTDGVPLYLEEMTRAVLESGSVTAPAAGQAGGQGAKLGVPTGLQGLLLARLDRLSPAARDVAQAASALSPGFPYDLVVAAAQRNEIEVRRALDELVAAGLMFRVGNPPAAVYEFKHALVQDTAYSTLLRDGRKALHRRLAQALEARLTAAGGGKPEIVAHHFAEAGDAERAASYWLQAGRREADRYANVEATALLKRGIDALSSLPETPQRRELELALQLALGLSVMAVEGYASADGEAAYRRASTLAAGLGDDRSSFTAAWGRWLARVQSRLDGDEVTDLLAELFRRAEATGDDGFRLQAHHAAWVTKLWLGQPEVAHHHVTQGLALYDSARHGRLAMVYGGHDAAVCAKGHGAIALWMMGYPDRAVASARRGIDLAGALGHPPSVAHALWLAGFLHMMRRDPAAGLQVGERLIALSREHNVTIYPLAGRILRGWARALLGAPEAEGLAEMREAARIYRSHVGVMAGPFLVSLADSERRAGHFDRAEATLIEAEAVITQRSEQLWVGGVQRCRGDVAASRPSPDFVEAERRYGQALEIARSGGTRTLELRAAKGLARVWRRHGKVREAHLLLAPIMDWFTEGFDTADLLEARTLLAALSRESKA